MPLSIPSFFIHSNMCYHHIVALSKDHTNDQEFGRMVRAYIEQEKDTTAYGDKIELDYIGEGGIKEMLQDSKIESCRYYFLRDEKLYMTNDFNKILTDEVYSYCVGPGICRNIKKDSLNNNTSTDFINIDTFTVEQMKNYLYFK